MSNTIIFSNPGEIDLRSISLFGVSVKDNDNPIGFFGTGLKFSIAVLLRNNCDITIWSGKTKIWFETYEESFRGKSITLVRMYEQLQEPSALDGQYGPIVSKELGFDISLGKNWKLWMAYRELYCNCKDEGGNVSINEADAFAGTENMTIISVTSDEFTQIHRHRTDFILESKPFYTYQDIEIHKGTPTNSLFYKGIKVAQAGNENLYRYNYTGHVDLTEDRTCGSHWSWQYELKHAVAQSKDPAFIKEMLLRVDNDDFELLDYSNLSEMDLTEEFINVVIDLETSGLSHYNKTALECVESIQKKNFKPASYTPSAIENKMLTKALAFLDALGFPMVFNISYVHSIAPNVYGRADSKDNTILISRDAFGLGTKFLATTLLEEHIHLKYGHRDNSREMQNFLFNLVGTLGEQINGEPL